MARPLVLSNGELHVGINNYGLVHDFYFPYVGLENHSASNILRHKIGVWIDGKMSWLDQDENWKFQFRYPHVGLIGHTVARNEALGVLIEFDDTVDASMSALLRNLHVVNLKEAAQEIRLFMHQAFAIGDSRTDTDTAQYLPDSDAIVHYRGRRAFIVAGRVGDKPFDQHSIGLFGVEGHEGTYKDAEDGELSGSVVDHGRVDSVIRFTLNLTAHSSERVHYWIAAGTSIREALYVHKQVSDDGVDARLESTAQWWHKWLEPAVEVAQKLPEHHRKNFIESVMVIKSQIDKRGAVIASTDTAMLNYEHDTYAYAWPRDGAYTVWPLIRMGYRDEAYRFFEFCKRGLHPSGYLMHKYRADGALGSSWHPYVQPNGDVAPPIQEDETALVLFVFCQYYTAKPDASLLKDFYQSMVTPMADFLASYIDHVTGLPKASYDLWEEVYETTTYTTAVTYAALVAASDLAATAGDDANAVKWRAAAVDIQAAAHKHLYNEDRKAFYKGVLVTRGVINKDPVIDTSGIFGSFLFGLFDVNSEEIRESVASTVRVFQAENPESGLPRYENDPYHRVDPSVTGNWWYITSLWLVQYDLTIGKHEQAVKRLDWLLSLIPETGIMGEQIDPRNGAQVAPSPLTWSHSEYVSTLLDLVTEEA